MQRPWPIGLAGETRDPGGPRSADAIIVRGIDRRETRVKDVDIVRRNTDLPILIGSGATPENLHKVYSKWTASSWEAISRRMARPTTLSMRKRVKIFADALAKQRRKKEIFG